MFVQFCFLPDSFLFICISHPLSSSLIYRCSYSPHGAYAQSKLALVLFTYRLQHLLTANGSHVTANVVDPGVVNTELYKHVFWVVKVFKWMTAWLLFKVCIYFFFPHRFVAISLRCECCSQHGAEYVSQCVITLYLLCSSALMRRNIDKDKPCPEQMLMWKQSSQWEESYPFVCSSAHALTLSTDLSLLLHAW